MTAVRRWSLLAALLLASGAACLPGGTGDQPLPSREALDAESNTLARGMLDIEGVLCADVDAAGTFFEDYGALRVTLVVESADPDVWTVAAREALRRAWVSGLAPVGTVRLVATDAQGAALGDEDEVFDTQDPTVRSLQAAEALFGPRPSPLPAPAATDPGPPGCDPAPGP